MIFRERSTNGASGSHMREFWVKKGNSRLWVLQVEIDPFANGVVGSCTTKFLVKWVLYVGGFLNIDPARNGMSLRFLMPVRKCMC